MYRGLDLPPRKRRTRAQVDQYIRDIAAPEWFIKKHYFCGDAALSCPHGPVGPDEPCRCFREALRWELMHGIWEPVDWRKPR